jgi:autotransporter-associated beta strand protein
MTGNTTITTPSAVSLNGVISGAFSLTKSGTNSLTLMGANTYTAGTTLNAGAVYVGNDAAFGTGLVAIVGSTVSSDGTQGRTLANAYSFGGSVTLGNATRNGLLTLTGLGTLTSNTTLNTASDVVLSGVVGGAVSLTKSGAGALTLSGANTFAGPATMTSGSVYVGNDAAFGLGTLAMNGAVISSDSGTARTIANTFTMGGARTLGNATRNGVLTFTGAGTMTSATTLTVASNVVMSGVLGGAFALTKTGSGELTLGGGSANSYTGTTTVNDGTLTLSGGSAVIDAGAVVVTAPGVLKLAASETIGSLAGDGAVNLQTFALTVGGSLTTTYSGVMTGTGTTPALVKSGSGALTLSGANTFSGGSTLNGGLLFAGNNAALGTGAIGMSGGVTLASDSTTARTLTNAYSLDAAVTVGHATNTGVLTLSGSGSLAANTTLTVNSDVVMSGILSGAFTLTKDGSGALTLGGANTFSGGATLSAGAVYVGNDLAFGSGSLAIAGSTVSSDGTTARSMANAYSFGGAVTLGNAAKNGVLTFTGAGTLTSNTTLTTESDVVLQGAVGGGAVSLTKLGAGSLTLSGANTFSGGATLNAGAVYVGNNAAFGDVSGMLRIVGSTVASTAATGGGGGDRTIGNAYELGGAVALGDAVKTGKLTFTGAGALTSDLTLTTASDVAASGVVSGAFGLTKVGAGELTLSGTNTFSGATAVNGGTLTVSGGAALLDTVAVTVGAAGTLKLNASETIGTLAGVGAVNLQAHTLTVSETGSTTFGGVMSGTGNFLKTGGGMLTLSGASTASGWVSVRAGGVEFGAGAALGASTLYVAPASTGLSTAVGATFTLGAGKVLGGGGALNGSFVVDAGGRLEPGIADPSISPAPSASVLLNTQVQATGTFAINGEVKLRLGASGTMFSGGGSVATAMGNSKADQLTITGGLSIGVGSTITVVANDGTNGDGTPTAPQQVGRYDLITYSGARSGSFFTNKTDLTTLFNAPTLRPAWFDDPVSKIIGIIVKRQADGDFDATAGLNETDGSPALPVDFGLAYRGDVVTRTVRVNNVASGGIFSERLRAQLVDTASVGLSADAIEVEPSAGGDLVITMSTATARKFVGSLVEVQIHTLTDSPGGVVTSQLVETLQLSVSGEVIGRGYAPWGWGATAAKQLGTPTSSSDAFGGTVGGLATTSGSTTVTVSSTAGLGPGVALAGAGIPAGAKVSSVTNGTVFLMSASATATASGGTLSYVSTSRLKPDSLAPETFFEGPNLRMTTFGAGASHSIFADSQGRAWTVGSNAMGQHGKGTFGGADSADPVELTGLFKSTVRLLTVAGSNEVQAESVVGLTRGQLLSGAGLPSGTTVVVVAPAPTVERPNAGTVILSSAATVSSADFVSYTVYRRITHVAAGGTMSLALLDSGALYAWGGNANGQLGVGSSGTLLSRSANPMPVRMDGAMNGWRVKSVVVGGRGLAKGCVLRAGVSSGTTLLVDNVDGVKVGWALSGSGVTAGATVTAVNTVSSTVTVSVRQTLVAGTELHFGSTEGTHVLAVASNVDASGTVLETGVFAWGRNDAGQLGNGSAVESAVPVRMALPKATATAAVSSGRVTGVTMVSRGAGYTVAPRVTFSGGGGTGAAGTAVISGGLVTGVTMTSQGTGYTSPPQVWIAAGLDVVDVAAGDGHSLVLMSDGSVYACGRNTLGQLGDKTTVGRSTPVRVVFSDSALIKSVGAGGDHSLAVSTTGKVYTWGSNALGQLGLATGTINALIAAKFATATVVRTPAEVTGLSGKVAGSATGGRGHSLVSVRELTGWKVFGFGANHRGQIGKATPSPGLSSSVPVEADLGAMGGATVSRVHASGDSSYAVGGLTVFEPLSSLAFLPVGMSESLLSANPLMARAGAGGRVPLEGSVTGLATSFGSTTVAVASTSGLMPGMPLTGVGVPVGALVASVTSGTTFEMTLSATATGTGGTLVYNSPRYQWYKDGVAIPGATASAYTVPSVDVSSAADIAYHFVVGMGIEEFVSNTLLVSVRDSASAAPVVVTHPVSRVVASGSVALSVSAVDTMTGRDDTLTYKWYRSRDGVSWFTTGDISRTVPAAPTGFVYKCLVKGLNGATEGIFSGTAFVRALSTLVGKHVGVLENTEVEYGSVTAPKFVGRMTLDITSTGLFTGRVEYEGTAYSLSGDILAAASGLAMTISRTAPRGPVGLVFAFDGLLGGVTVAASHTDGGVDVRSASSLRMSPISVATSSRGVFGAALASVGASIVSTVPGLDQAMPILQVTTGSTGTVTYTGRMADGVSVSGSGSLVTDSAGRLVVPLFASMYGVYPYAGQVAGTLVLTPAAVVKVAGDVEWRKPDLTRWSTTAQKGTYVRGAVATYQVLPEATVFSATGFTSMFKPDGVWYSTTFSSSQWDTGTRLSFRTSTTTTTANYSGNIVGVNGVTTDGLTGLVFSKAGGTISLNYIRNGRVNYGYGLMFPGGKVYGLLMVDDLVGSGAWWAQ